MTINRKNDYAFKRIFGHEDTKDILADFLTDTLSTPVKPEEITLVSTELSPDYLRGKSSRLDIRIKRSAFHEKMNVEMQCEDEGNIERRILFYWGKSYTEELEEGDDYSSLPRQINIVIADFGVFNWKDSKKFHSVFHVLEKDEPVMFSDALEIHVLELPKLKRRPAVAGLSGLECWGLYLNNLGGEEMRGIAERKPAIKRAMTIEDIFVKNEEERQMYELREKGRRDYTNAINTAEKRGTEKGKAEGKEEKALEVARKMLARDMSIGDIVDLTGLDEKDILSLQ